MAWARISNDLKPLRLGEFILNLTSDLSASVALSFIALYFFALYLFLKEEWRHGRSRFYSAARYSSLGRFPKQVKLSERTSAWIESEVEAFMDARIVERDNKLSEVVPPLSPYMRMGQVMKLTGLNSASIYDFVRNGEFPKWAPRPKIASGWLRMDIEEWMASRPKDTPEK